MFPESRLLCISAYFFLGFAQFPHRARHISKHVNKFKVARIAKLLYCGLHVKIFS
jgi:hypothetical protein